MRISRLASPPEWRSKLLDQPLKGVQEQGTGGSAVADWAEAVWPEVHEFRGGNSKHFATTLVSRDGRPPTSYSRRSVECRARSLSSFSANKSWNSVDAFLGRHYGGWCMVPDSSEELELRGGSPRLCQAITKNLPFRVVREIDGAYFLVQRQFESPDDQLNLFLLPVRVRRKLTSQLAQKSRGPITVYASDEP